MSLVRHIYSGTMKEIEALLDDGKTFVGFAVHYNPNLNRDVYSIILVEERKK